jgi:hypothetical protein
MSGDEGRKTGKQGETPIRGRQAEAKTRSIDITTDCKINIPEH